MKNSDRRLLLQPAVLIMPYLVIRNISVYDVPDFAGVLQQPFEDNEHKLLQVQTCFERVVLQLFV